jgi:hypothetical protein
MVGLHPECGVQNTVDHMDCASYPTRSTDFRKDLRWCRENLRNNFVSLYYLSDKLRAINIILGAYRRLHGGTRLRSWLRHYARSRKVAGSIPDEIIKFLNWPNTSSSIMAQGSTQPVTVMNIRNLPGGKGRPAHTADNLSPNCEPIV